MGKYKGLAPSQVAGRALSRLLEKIPEMKRRYAEEMERFAADPEAQERYLLGVEAWVMAMRSDAVKRAIRQALAVAKDEYDALRKRKPVVTGTVSRATVAPVIVERG